MNSYEEMFPDEWDDLIAVESGRIQKIAVLPVGSVEQHGPHLLLGCDGYVAHALAAMVAEKTHGVLFPMLPFSWIGGLRPFAGTIDMRPFITGDYMEAVAIAILRQGFDRLVLINSHGGGREMVFSVARRVFKATGKQVITMYPTFLYENWPEIVDIWQDGGMEFDWSAIEAAELAGSLLYLGEKSLSDQVLKNTWEAAQAFGEEAEISMPPGLEQVFSLSYVGHDYHNKLQHVWPKKKVVRDTALKVLDFMAEKIAAGATEI